MNVIHDETDKYFCYFYIRLIGTSVLGFVEITAIGLTLLVIAIKQYKKILRITTMGKNLLMVYISIFAQCIIYTLRVGFLETIFWVYRGQEHTRQQSLKMQKISKYTFAVDIIGIFAIQSMFILVCYNWMDKTVEILQRFSQLEDLSEVHVAQTNQYLRFQRICEKGIKFYMYLRFLFYGLVLGYVLSQTGNFSGGSFYLIILFLVSEAVFVPLLLAIGVFAIKRNKRLTQLVGSDQIKIMMNQYGILIICTLIRFGFGLIVVIQGLGQDTEINSDTCYVEKDQPSKFDQFWVIVNVFQDIFCYFIPVFMVLRIFKVDQRNLQMSASLLGLDYRDSSSTDKRKKNIKQ